MEPLCRPETCSSVQAAPSSIIRSAGPFDHAYMECNGARMRNPLLASFAALLASIAISSPTSAQHEHSANEPERLGHVEFSTSCDPALQLDFNRAVAMLHSFWYQKSAETFAAIAKQDPSCGMAQWGVAMSHYHQLWDTPSPVDLKAGWAAVEAAKSANVKTQRERDYISAMEVFYKDSDKVDHHTRAPAYEKSMEQLQARYPQDREAQIFYALALRTNAPPADKTYANQKKASAILQKILAEQPDHPGLAHYIIHCDDYPSLASQALDAARSYAKIAPDAPHALHMPSHIFTRMGLWQESIDSNRASAAAAKKNGLAGDELHAADYLVYAYLQTGQDREARKILDSLPHVQPGDAAYFAGLYATASIPARFAVERHNWKEAAALTLPSNAFPGGRYLWTEGDLYFARALGAARMGDVHAARSALQQLTSLRDNLLHEENKYSAEQVDIQREIVTAWISLAQGQQADALQKMRAAADHEDATEKLPVTPGPIVPARELLGEMLLASNQPAPALEAFESALRSAPQRLNSLYGAAQSANLAGDLQRAKNYYTQLVANCPQADPARPELREAKTFLAKTGVVVTKFFQPTYPPLARQTRISGDVRVSLSVRPDGSIESVEIVSGHPLLGVAALDSAHLSLFECRKCSEPLTSFSLVYSFRLSEPECCDSPPRPTTDAAQPSQPSPPFTQVSDSEAQITVTGRPTCLCDPSGTITWPKARSAKCLYLWRCSSRVTSQE